MLHPNFIMCVVGRCDISRSHFVDDAEKHTKYRSCPAALATETKISCRKKGVCQAPLRIAALHKSVGDCRFESGLFGTRIFKIAKNQNTTAIGAETWEDILGL